jgi:hypothetical protein
MVGSTEASLRGDYLWNIAGECGVRGSMRVRSTAKKVTAEKKHFSPARPTAV